MRRIFEEIQTIEDMSLLNGVAFEEFLADVFRDSGYEVDTTPKSGDYGADLIMARGGKRVVVQAKQYAGPVGFDAVKEVHFAKDFYKAAEAWVIATHGFTPQAISAAESTGVRLISGSEILKAIEESVAHSSKREAGSSGQLELSLGDESDSSLFTLAGEYGYKLLQYHGHERNVVIPSGLGIRFIGSQAFSDPGKYACWPEGFVDPVCDWARIQSIVVPEGVTMIGYASFRGCKSLQSISLPSTLRYIGPSAFEDCVALREIVLPQGIETIGSAAFAGCKNLTSLVFPSSTNAVEIGGEAFRESGIRSLALHGNYRLESRCFERCFSLRCVDIEGVLAGEDQSIIGMESIPESAFEHCRMLNDVRLPDTLASIGENAFAKCVSLQTIEIPESVTEIGSKAFFECSRLSSIRIPPGIEAIRRETFTRCTMLSEVSLSEGLKSIDEEAFFVCKRMRRISLPTTVEEVASRAFAGCDALACVVMSPNVRTIRTRTFSGCTVLNDLVLPEGLQSIEKRAFWKCKWLKKVKFPASIKVVAPGAFEDCEDLEDVSSSPDCSGTFYRSAFLGCPRMERDDPIQNLPDTATLVNDARFPSMFDGAAHELRALRFDTYDSKLLSVSRIKGYRIVDHGVEGLNRYSGNSEGDIVSFWIVLNDGCDQGFYCVRGASSASKQESTFEGYLEPKMHGYSSADSSRHGFGIYTDCSVYLCHCHLAVSPSIDGALAAHLVDAYRDEISPLVEEYKRVEKDESGRGRKFEEAKLSALDGLYERIKAVNAEFESGAKKAGLDYTFYIREYSASLGYGISPSAKAAQLKALNSRSRTATRARYSGSSTTPFWRGCGCFTYLVVFIFLTFLYLMGLFLI